MVELKSSEFLTTLSANEARELKNRVVRKIMGRGKACAPDLANEITVGTGSPRLIGVDDLLVILQELVNEGVLRVASDPDKSREYKGPHQTVFEVAI